MKKIFRTLHLWLSVPFGLLVSLICFSGAMLVFENENNRMEPSRPLSSERDKGGTAACGDASRTSGGDIAR